jgi:hypoxanthine phosphoribosyltransferase
MTLSEENLSKNLETWEELHLGRVLISQQALSKRVLELGQEIRGGYDRNENFELVIVAIMTGAMVFLSDLIRAMPIPLRLAIMMVSNYPGESISSKGVKVIYDLKEDVEGKDILIVDDIIDTGETLVVVDKLLRNRGAKSVRSCVLLDKMIGREKSIRPDFVGFTIPNEFVVGYGMDYDNLYRNLPYIAVLEKEDQR